MMIIKLWGIHINSEQNVSIFASGKNSLHEFSKDQINEIAVINFIRFNQGRRRIGALNNPKPLTQVSTALT